MNTSHDGQVRDTERARTGIEGLDQVLHGGFPRDRLYLIDGDPGTGKTTVGLQFLREGAREGEPTLYVTLSEAAEELHAAARSHGWSLDGIQIHEFMTEGSLAHESQYTVFQPSEIELGNTMSELFAAVEQANPSRVVIDSLSDMRLLARDPLRYRRQILSLKEFFRGRRATVLLLDDRTFEASDRQLHSIAHGVIRLEQLPREYGPSRRRLQVVKIRGTAYREGLHDFVIRRGGLVTFPRLVAGEHESSEPPARVLSGIPELDAMTGGGLSTGTTALFMGPAGVGKSILAAHYAIAAARDGRPSTFFVFDEERETLLRGTASVGIPLREEVETGRASIRAVNPAELSPGEFVHLVRDSVEREGAGVVVIDSLNGYLSAMPEESMLGSHLRELFSYLRQRGVLTLTTMAVHGVLGHTHVNIDVSYLADAVVLLRFFEREAALHRAISVVKQRACAHATEMRELTLTSNGVVISPLTDLHGVLTGVPQLLRVGGE